MKITARVWTAFIILCLTSTTIAGQTSVQDELISIPYWYTASDAFDLNLDDDWFPLPEYDVPYSLPLRGYNSHSRNYFIDLGALDWYSDFLEYYGYTISPYERGLNETHTSYQLEFLFELMTDRLAEPEGDPIPALNYMQNFEGAFDVYVPLVVMFDLNNSYEEADMDEWAIHPSIISETLNEAFPLINWTVELFWFDYDDLDATAFVDLVEEKTFDDRINVDRDFLDGCDVVLHDIISDESQYEESDFVLPSLVLFQEYPLYSVWSQHGFRGMGRIQSVYDEISTWSINSLKPTSLFFGGDPAQPRFSITGTILHELCHCIGQTDIHSSFGWILTSTTTSVMAAYTRDPHFDRFDKDLINNGQALQLLGKYLDEIDYFRSFSLSTSQSTDLQGLETSLSGVQAMIILSDYISLESTLQSAESFCIQLASDLGITRKSEAWSDNAPALDVQVDWIIGPGFTDIEGITETIESRVDLERELLSFAETTLPSPLYDMTIDVHAVDDAYGNTLLEAFGSQIVESQTSFFVEELVPEDAWDTYPINRLLQNVSGYAMDGDTAEQWLVDNPATPDEEDTLQYRFYIFNLANITPPENDPLLLLIIAGGISGTVVIVAVVAFRRRDTKSVIDT